MNDFEDRLRTAVRSEADRIEPDEAGSLATIRTRGRAARRRRQAIGGSAIALAIAAVLALSPRLPDRQQDVDLVDDPSPSPTTTSTPDITSTTTVTESTTTAPTVTEAPPTSEATEAPPVEPTSEVPTLPDAPVLWPSLDHAALTDPATAARSFTQEFMGFGDPALSGFRAGTSPDQGEVDVYWRAEDGQAMDRVASTLSLLQHEGRWYVASARAADVVVDSPAPGEQVSSPLTVQGQGRGFEGTIHVEIRTAHAPSGQALGRASTTAGAGEELGPFTVTLPSDPPAGAGAIVATNDSGVAGGTVSFTALPVTFT